jgi:glycosyltransferase involved in cell wall biosynthesis
VLIRTAKYVMDLEKPKILEMTDAISLNYKKSLQKTTSLKWKLIYKIEYPRLVKFEKKCARVFNKTLLVNKEEAEYLDYDKKIVWLPNGVSERLLTYEKKNPRYKNCICFYGKMNYQPNIDAVMWFVENVLPRLNEEIKFCIVGTNPTNKIKKLEKKYHNVIVTGFVQDPYEILKSCLCVVAPMQTGAGIQNKVLESMALGTVNIVSSLSAKPIGAKSYEHFIIEDNPKKIAEIIHDIYSGSKKYESIKLRSRKYIKNNFTWDIYEDKLIEIIEKLLNK